MDPSFLYGACGGGVVGVLMVILVTFLGMYLWRTIAARDRLAAGRIDRIEQTVDAHIRADRSGEIWTELKSISGNVEKLLSQQQVLLVSDEGQRQQIVTLFNAQTELKSELKDCKREHR